MTMALRKLCARELKFRWRELDEFPTSLRQDLEETTHVEKAFQEAQKVEMPYGHRYFDWDEKLQRHRGIYIRQSADDDFDPEKESALPALPSPPPSPPSSPPPSETKSNLPRTSCGPVVEGAAPAVQPEDSSASEDAAESDTLSNASTLVAEPQRPAVQERESTRRRIVSFLRGLLPTTEPQLALIVVFLYLVSLQFRGFNWGVSTVLLLGVFLRMRLGW